MKEDELNSIIVEMRRHCTSLQEKLVKEELERTVSEIFKSMGESLEQNGRERLYLIIVYTYYL